MHGRKGLGRGSIGLLLNGALSGPHRYFIPLCGLLWPFRRYDRSAPFQHFQKKKGERNQNNYDEEGYERPFSRRLFSAVNCFAPTLSQTISPFGLLAFYSTSPLSREANYLRKGPPY